MATNSLTHLNINFNGASFLLDVAEGKLMSLNTIYAAAGSPAGKEPWRWLDTEGSKQFIDSVCEILNLAKTVVLKVKRGRRGGGTWAHWKIAVRYAAYLAPALDSAILDVFQERVQEEINPGKAVDRGIEGYKKQGKSNDWIEQRVKSKTAWVSLTDELKDRDTTNRVYSQCADSINVPIMGGTAKMVKKQQGLKPSANLRDYQDEVTLALLNVAQVLSKDKIVKEDRRGDKSCVTAYQDVATRVAVLRS
jgi:hypothetical protein